MRTMLWISSIVVFGYLSAGCQLPATHIAIHPTSQPEHPMFCHYDDWERTEPYGIYRIRIDRLEVKTEPGSPELRVELDSDYESDTPMWELRYTGSSSLAGRIFSSQRQVSCVTYGDVPPGYEQIVAPAPLESEQLYGVEIRGRSRLKGYRRFVIRSGDNEDGAILEYLSMSDIIPLLQAIPSPIIQP